jgi:hypothetical protein
MTPAEIKEMEFIKHFYFCLLVAIRLHQNSYPHESHKGIILFIKRWLDNAQKMKLFPCYILDDICFLRNEIKSGKDGKEMELIINKAYDLFTELIESANKISQND